MLTYEMMKGSKSFYHDIGHCGSSCSQYFSTPLHVVLEEGRSHDITRLLMKCGADLGNRNAEGKTPLHTFFNPIIASIIVRVPEAFDEATTCDNYGMTMLHYIAWSSKSGPEHFYNMKRQICHFAEADHDGRTALHFACQRGNVAILHFLFQLKIDIGIRRCDKMGRTAFHYAVQSKRTMVIDLIFSRDNDIRAVDSRGRTVLHHAAMCNNLASVKRVLELGGHEDLFSVDIDGLTPAALANRYRLHAIVEYFDTIDVENGSDPLNHQRFGAVVNRGKQVSRWQGFFFRYVFLLCERHSLSNCFKVILLIVLYLFIPRLMHRYIS